MATLKMIAFTITAIVALTGDARGQHCRHGDDESAGEHLRRDAAVKFIAEVNAAQTRRHGETGRYSTLAELQQASTPPLGFVPRVVVDQFGYALKVVDALDPCRFALFSDEGGVVFEAHPTMIAPDQGQARLSDHSAAASDGPTAAADQLPADNTGARMKGPRSESPGQGVAASRRDSGRGKPLAAKGAATVR